MLQPAGHVGIWFETEPSDPLDRLVWKSQQFVGQPLELEPLGENARTPDSVALPANRGQVTKLPQGPGQQVC